MCMNVCMCVECGLRARDKRLVYLCKCYTHTPVPMCLFAFDSVKYENEQAHLEEVVRLLNMPVKELLHDKIHKWLVFSPWPGHELLFYLVQLEESIVVSHLVKLESQNFNSLHHKSHLCDGASLRTGNVKKSGLIRPNLLDFRKCSHFILKNEGKSSWEGSWCFHKVTDLTVKRMHSYLCYRKKNMSDYIFFHRSYLLHICAWIYNITDLWKESE